MDTGVHSFQPSTNIPLPQTQKQVKAKLSVKTKIIIMIVLLFISISSTIVLAYQNIKINKIIYESSLQDYFYENNDSVTVNKILQTPYINGTDEQIAQELKNIQDEEIRAAREKALADINPATASTPSIGFVKTNELEKLISFDLPANFSKSYLVDETNKPLISINSNDFKYSAGLNFTSGINISITKQQVDTNYTINNEDNEANRKYLQDFKIFTLGGKPAAFGFLGFETYSDRYFVLNNLDKWTIYIAYGGNTLQEGLNTKAKYKAEIDQLLSSITFK